MKRFLQCAFFLSAVLLVPPIFASKGDYEIQGNATTTPIAAPVASLVTSSTLKAWVDTQAEKYGVNPALADCIIMHESQWQPEKPGDIGNPHGESFGLWQIEVHQHPDVTIAEALDYRYATDWALEQIKAGNVQIWSTYSQKPFYCRAIRVLE